MRFTYFNINIPNNISNQYSVIEDYNGYVILENDGRKILYYDDNKLNVGNKIYVNGDINIIEKEGDFNEYLYTQRVYLCLNGKVEFNNNNLTISTKIINKLLAKKDEENKKILKLILFNIKDEENLEFYNFFSTFSLNFLIVISGFHINVLFKFLGKFKWVKYLLVCFYLILLNLSISSLKAFIYIVLKKISRKFNWRFNNCDLLSFILISLLFINPSYCFNLGFIYTFLFSFFIEYSNNIISSKKLKNKIGKKCLIFMVSMPLILLSNYEINIFSPIMIMLFEIPISAFFLFSLIYLFFDKFYLIYKWMVYFMKFIFGFASSCSHTLVFGKPGILVIMLFYLSLFLFLYFYQNKMKKIATIFLLSYALLMSLQYLHPMIDSREVVYFIDVGQGDCSALKIPNSKSVVLIDTGGSKYRDVAKKDIIPFLKEKGINKIEKIIITHDDYDHNGALDVLQREFVVEEVVDNSMINSVNIGNTQFINLNISEERGNDGSLVLYGVWGELKYLFTGDISSDVENELLEKNDLDVDILKVSHHGSNTSTSEQFIKNITPQIALIGVGKNNMYDHPSSSVIDTLEKYDVKIYRSDYHGNLEIYKSIFTNSIIIEKEKDMV